jgi:hypothetical protein
LIHHLRAVDVHRLAADEARARPGEKAHHCRDFLGLACAADRNRLAGGGHDHRLGWWIVLFVPFFCLS